MATVTIQRRERKNRVSYLVNYRDPLTGRKKYYKTFQKKRDAQNAANELRSIIDNGQMAQIQERKSKIQLLTVSEIIEALKKDWNKKNSAKSQKGLAQATVANYTAQAKVVEKDLGSRLLCKFDEEGIKTYLDQVAEETSIINANRRQFILKQIFAKRFLINAIRGNPTAGLPYASEKNHQRTKFLSPAELNTLLSACT